MEIWPVDTGQHPGDRLRGPLAPLGQPLLHFLEAVLSHRCHGGVMLGANPLGIEARGGAEGRKQGLTLLLRPVALGETIKDLGEPHCEQRVAAESALPAEQMQLDEKLIDHAPVQRTDHIGKGCVEGTLAVSNGEAGAHTHPHECLDISAAPPGAIGRCEHRPR